MRLAVEHAGAERGLLILLRGDEPQIEAEVTTGHERVAVTVRRTVVTPSDLPQSALHYVIRTRQRVLLDDASVGNLYSEDEYLRQKRTRSVLCVPIVTQTKLVGALYLENNLTPRAFTSDRVTVLELLASQAAISLQNAALYADLQRGEAFLAEGQNISHTGSFGWNVANGEIYWSAETYNIFEHDRAVKPRLEMLLQRVHADDRDRVRQTLDLACETGANFDFEHRLLMADGSFKHLHVSARVLTTSSEELEYVGAVTDITGAKQAEERLRWSEADLHEAQRMSHTGSWKLDVSSGTVTGSPQMFRLYGVKPDEDPSNFALWFGRSHPEDQKRMRELFERSKIQKTDYDADYRIVLPDGAVKHIHTNGHPVLNDSGDVVEFVGTNMEISERKHAEEALWRSEGYLADAKRLAHIGVWARNVGSSNSIYRSQEIYRLFGFDPESGLPSDQAFYSRIHPEDRDRATIMAFHERTPKGADFDLEFRVVLPDGGIKYIRSAGRPVRNMSGEVTEYVGISMDVTERKRAEDERERLRQLEADLAHRNRLTMLGVLASSLAHELNQPIAAAMTSANACLQWLAHNPPNLERARAAAMRLENDGSRAA